MSNRMPMETMALYLGSHVLLRDGHPHAGRQGKVKSLDALAIGGHGLLIRFTDDGPGIGGEDGCYVFKSEELTVLKGGPSWKKYCAPSPIDDDALLTKYAKECLTEGFKGLGWKDKLVDSDGNLQALRLAIKKGYRMAVKKKEQDVFGELD